MSGGPEYTKEVLQRGLINVCPMMLDHPRSRGRRSVTGAGFDGMIGILGAERIRKQETGDFQPPPRCLVLATPAATIRTPKTTEKPLLGVAGTSSRIFGLKVSGRGVEDMRRLRSCANQGFETKHEEGRSKDEKAVPEKSRTHTLL